MRPASSILACALWWNCQVSILTYHNDLARTGQNLNETILTPANVSSGQFGRLFSYAVDGQVYAQPLYLPGVVIPRKGIHNVVFVVTEHDSVYAFDADNNLGAPLWHANFLNPAQGITAASATDLVCGSIAPEVGITATPVIDAASGTLYVVAMTEQASTGTYAHWLHALDVTTGAERSGSPVEIQASVPGAGDGNTTVQFKPWLYKERAGLLLLNGAVYTSWSSQCDSGNYHGWVIAYNTATLQQSAVYADTPNWQAGAFWQGGAAPAADGSGNIYVVSANGTFDANMGGQDLGESVIRLSTGQSLSATDYFTPYNAAALTAQDLDLGSSGALLLPDSAGTPAHPHLLVTGSKSGTVYLLDRDNLGAFNSQGDPQIVQSLASTVGPVFGVPAYFNNTVYFSGAHDQVKALSIQNGLLSTVPVSASSATFAVLGTVPSISSSGSANGILWTIDPAGLLHAFDAADLSQELYQGSVGSSIKFSTPTVANGKVYVGTADSLTVFGLQDPNPGSIAAVVTAAGFQPGPLTPGSLISIFGSNLAPHTALAPGSTWPELLDGVSVFINGTAAPLGYVNPAQINAQLPIGTSPGQATLTVVSGGRVLPPVEVTVRERPLK
ncbi:MAG TPA: IPT/TIG domain-containing protein [Bryobacteraceae bacterium]|nr:IPT/TIG domain-containing protein [Bryobacteraceae bacterium]